MDNLKTKSIVCMLGMVCATMVLAQNVPYDGQPPRRESADVRAMHKTQFLRDTLKLNSDQFNQVYKVYYKEYSALEQQMMPQGGPGGMLPGGMPPGGMPPSGMPPQGMNFGDMPATPPQPVTLTPEQLQKQQTKRQKKMKQILTPEQYELWFLLDTTPVLPPPGLGSLNSPVSPSQSPETRN